MDAPHPKILIIDDDELLAEYWKSVLEGYGYGGVTVCSDERNTSALFAETEFDMVLLDLHLPHISGRELLARIREEHPEVPVVIITVEDRVDTAVACMKAGAFDFLTKPVMESRLISIIRHAVQIRELQLRVSLLESQTRIWDLKHPEAFREIITKSDIMYGIFAYIEAISPGPKAVLVTGESGTGKELVARVIHRLSGRHGRFVPVNVGGLDDALFSDTLFGHRKGAFSGADTARKGLVESAAEGTLFLDEIGDLETGSQVKLLRLLQEEEYYPLGADRPETSRVRIVAATNSDLKAKLRDGTFRKDLYYRLMTHHIEIPPLRDRTGDLPLLVSHFVREASEQLGKEPPSLPKKLLPLLAGCPFPGNIRELQALVYDAVSRCGGGSLEMKIFTDYRDRQEKAPKAALPPAAEELSIDCFPTLRETEDRLIEQALNLCGGNQSSAARLLGVSQSTLSRRLASLKNSMQNA